MSLPGRTIAFRADASAELGLGHVLRCKTLADVLTQRGQSCHFICRELPDHLAEALLKAGVKVHRLKHAPDASSDAGQTARILDEIGADLLVLDHYSLDATWTDAIGGALKHVTLDDLANRPHRCALLIDQNLGRKKADYDGFLAPETRRLIGPKYALLRPDFIAARSMSLKRRATVRTPTNILVSMGGMDAADVTSVALRGIAASPHIPENCQITVILGGQAPHLHKVQKLAADMPFPTRVLVDISDMASVMADADLAIGAAGGTAWERCVLGLPTLVAAVAQNQQLGAESLAAADAAILLPDMSEDCIGRAFGTLAHDPNLLISMSKAAARLCDGRGADRVASAIDALFLTVRQATMGDARIVFDWRNDEAARKYFENTKATPLEDHLRWFETAHSDPQRSLLIIELDGIPVCHIRFDRDAEADSDATVSIVICPDLRGRGLALACLQKAIKFEEAKNLKGINATVHRDNDASNRLFAAAGFQHKTDDGEFALYFLDLSTASNR